MSNIKRWPPTGVRIKPLWIDFYRMYRLNSFDITTIDITTI